MPFDPNPRLRARTHERGLSVVSETGLYIGNSALQTIIGQWNRLPQEYASLSPFSLRQKLKLTDFFGTLDDDTEMRNALRVL